MSVELLYSHEAEKAVLGCCLIQPDEVFDSVNVTLQKADFFVPAHQQVFEALRELSHAHQPIDLNTVHQWLDNRRLAGSVGSPGILAELANSFATHLNVSAYVKTVKDKSLLRHLRLACSSIAKDVMESADDVAGVLNRAEATLFKITHANQTEAIYDAKKCVAEYREERNIIQEGNHINRIPMGIRTLDDANGGLPNPGLVIIGAGTGGGKSIFMMNLLENWCRMGLGVGVFSLEMTRKQLVKRAVASFVPMDSRLLNRKLHDGSHDKVEKALSEIEGWKFWIDQTSRLTIAELRTRSRQMIKMGAAAIEVDYLQLMRGMNNRADRREQLAEISGEMKILSNELNVPFIVLSQVNREGRKSGDLQLLHLAECSALEQDADAVILLEQKGDTDGFPRSAIPYVAHIAKYRDGAIGDVEITLNAPHLKFT